MATGRNDPCPCGSGRKYKHCCMPRDIERAASESAAAGTGVRLQPHVLSSARDEAVWEVDTFAAPAMVSDQPDAIVSTTLVMAGTYVLSATADLGLPNEAAAVAEAEAKAVRSAAAKVGSWPPRLRVRHSELVAALAQELSDAPVRIECQLPLTYVPDARNSLVRSLADGDRRNAEERSEAMLWPVAMPETFAGWGLPDEVSAELFAAAADFHRAAAWRWIANAQVLYAELPSGRRYACSVLGNAGIEFGIQTGAIVEDIARLTRAHDPHMYDLLEGPVVTLTFNPVGDFAADYGRHIKWTGWAVPDDETVPMITALNTLAGGLPIEHARDVTALMRATPRFIAAYRDLLTGEVACDTWPVWEDEASGVRLSYRGYRRFDPVTHWPVPERLGPALATGPAAQPDRALDAVWLNMGPEDVAGYQDEVGAILVPMTRSLEKWLSATGLSGKTASRHANRALQFLTWLYLSGRTVIESVSELDLRDFLYRQCPLHEETFGRSVMDAMPTSLRRLFRFLADQRGLECPWAEAVLAERDAYLARRRGLPRRPRRPLAELEWENVLGADLNGRLLLPDERLGWDDMWDPEDGPSPSGLTGKLLWELGRRWLIWREEIVRSGVTDPEFVRAALLVRQRAWERSPHDQLDGRSPIEAVQAQRRAEAGRDSGGQGDTS